jgi:threonine/homoserine/homoserine lactone efflux protein
MLALLPTFVADAAEEGRNVILGMLATGLIFIVVVLLGELSRWAGKRRRSRRPSVY